MRFSACIEWLFADEASDLAERIGLAKRAGLDAVEFWLWSNKNIASIDAALKAADIPLTGFVAEPMIALTDPANREDFLAGLEQSVAVAQRLGARVLIAQAGNDLPGVPRQHQRATLVETLARAADRLKGTNVKLGLEPLNTLIDHPGYFLSSTQDALDIVDEISREEIGIVYDLYHSAVMGERIEDVLKNRVDRVVHAHVADHPGRNEPGSGTLDLRSRLAWLASHGYAGAVGLEYKPLARTSRGISQVLEHLRPN